MSIKSFLYKLNYPLRTLHFNRGRNYIFHKERKVNLTQAGLIHSTAICSHGEYEWKDPVSEDEVVMITVINKDGKETKVRGKVGDNVLYLSKRYDLDVEGACEASLACTTCHVYVDYEFEDKFPPATETEEDLLDAAPFLKDNSRLGCQLILAKEHNGLKLALPSATRNFYVDGHKPSHH